MPDDIAGLAAAVGLAERWTDIGGQTHDVSPTTLRHLLTTLGFPCDDAADRAMSLERLAGDRIRAGNSFMTATIGRASTLLDTAFKSGTARIIFENGTEQLLRLRVGKDRQLRLPGLLQAGYHHLEQGDRQMTVAVAPQRAYGVADAALGRDKLWGVAAQLYSLQDASGFGDFADLADLAERIGLLGGDAIAISPIHALFPGTPACYSPYSPSTRLFTNISYVAPNLVLPSGIVGPMPTAAELSTLIDWSQAVPAKLAWLGGIHRRFLEQAEDSLRAELAAFRHAGGESLERHALFEALHMRFAEQGSGWQSWPTDFQTPDGEGARRFAREQAIAVDFHIFLQWLADRGLAHAQDGAKRAGMAIGLITDLAIGMDPGGSHAWNRRDELLMGLNVGAPPDLINGDGQDWGLTALSPFALAADGYAPFIATLRAAMRHAGGVRIDHVLGLARLWLVPQGAGATHGAYLRFPIQNMLRLISLESHRQKAIVIGEDLGTVPQGFRKTLLNAGLIGMNVLWFERDKHGGFTPPGKWPKQRLALTSTHDLPTVAGWWRGRDADWQDRLKNRSPDPEGTERRARDDDRSRLWRAFVAAGCAAGPRPADDDPAPAVDAAVAFIARTSCEMAILPLEDLLGRDEQPNIPGTIDEHPNWRRRLPDMATSLDKPPVAARIETLRHERPRS